MKKETLGTVIVIATLAIGGAIVGAVGGGGRHMLFSLGCGLFAGGMAFALFVMPRIFKLLPVALLLVANTAKALLGFVVAAVVIAAGVGLIIWGVIQFVYLMMTVLPDFERNDIARVTKTEPVVLLAAGVRPLITATPLEIHVGTDTTFERVNIGNRVLEVSPDGVVWADWRNGEMTPGALWRLKE